MQNTEQHLKHVGWAVHGAGVLLLLSTWGLFYLCFWIPVQSKYASDMTQIQKLQRLVSNGQHVKQTYAGLRDELTELQVQIADTRARIPAKPQEAELLGQLTELTNGIDLVIDDFRRSQVANRGSHSELALELRAIGDYPAVCRFVQNVQQLRRLVIIDDLSIRRDRSDGRYSVSLKLLLYFGLTSRNVEET